MSHKCRSSSSWYGHLKVMVSVVFGAPTDFFGIPFVSSPMATVVVSSRPVIACSTTEIGIVVVVGRNEH